MRPTRELRDAPEPRLRAGASTDGAAGAAPVVALERWRDRIAAALVLALIYVGVYFATGLSARDTTDLMSTLDHSVPFWPPAIFVYASAYPLIFGPLFLIRDPALFRRIWEGYALCIVACGIVFWAWPVSAVTLRAPVGTGAPGSFADWGVQLIYALDPPRNCFPSLHLALATAGVLAVGRASRRLGRIGGIWLAALVLAVLLVKQHYVADAAGGLALGATAHALCAARWQPAAGTRPEDAWTGAPGALALAIFVGVVFAGAWGLRALGVSPPSRIW